MAAETPEATRPYPTAATQGPKTRKKNPAEQAEYFYNPRMMHILCFALSLLLLFSCAGMIYEDWARPWKRYQRAFLDVDLALLGLDVDRLQAEIEQRRAGELEEATRDLAREQEELPDRPIPPDDREHDAAVGAVARLLGDAPEDGVWRYSHLTRAIEKLKAPWYLADQDYKFRKSEYDSLRSYYERAAREYAEAQDPDNPRHERISYYAEEFQRYSALFDEARKSLAEALDRYEPLDTDWRLLHDVKFRMEQRLRELTARRTQIVSEIERLQTRYERERPNAVNAIRNAPVLDFFAPQYRIENKVLRDIQEDLHFETHTFKVDRCVTCHRGILNPRYAATRDAAGELHFADPILRKVAEPDWEPQAPQDRELLQTETVRRFLESDVVAALRAKYFDDPDARRTHIGVFRAHPKLEMFAGAGSPHDYERFGCTVCHRGDGRDTDFSRVVHIPANENEARRWHRVYNYEFRELWDFPMLPRQYIYASCRKCHREDVELRAGPYDRTLMPEPERDAATTSPAWNREDRGRDYRRVPNPLFEREGPFNLGMILYERLGCYACHKTDTYPVLAKDVPLRPDGSPDELARRRRPGPPLTHIADKVERTWAFYWIREPSAFRPTAKMPHFFGQANRRNVPAVVLDGDRLVPDPGGRAHNWVDAEQVVIGSMVEYIWSLSASQTDEYARREAQDGVDPMRDRGDVERGRRLFASIGCTMCHTQTRRDADGRLALRTRTDYERERGDPNRPTSYYLEEFAPALGGIGSKVNRRWLYHWLRDPSHYWPDTVMPNLVRSPQEALDLVEFLTASRDTEWEQRTASPPQISDAEGIRRALAMEILIKRNTQAEATRRILEMEREGRLERWLGEQFVTSYGCYGCHEMTDRNRWRLIPDRARTALARHFGTEDANRWVAPWDDPAALAALANRQLPPEAAVTAVGVDRSTDWPNLEGIGVELTGAQPVGSKFLDRFDFGNAHYDGVNYFGVVASPLPPREGAEGFGLPAEPITGRVHHSRHDWIRAKLLNPRLFDLGKLESKPPDELLRMPNFRLNEYEAYLLTTFVLSFTDEEILGLVERIKPPRDARREAVLRGERLIRDHNCRACHITDSDRILYTGRERDAVSGREVARTQWADVRYQGTLDPEMWEFIRPGEPGPWVQAFPLKDHVTLGVPSPWPEDDTLHARDITRVIRQRGGWEHARIVEEKERLGFPENQAQALVPPWLRTQGHKTRPEWLFRFLKDPWVIRPALDNAVARGPDRTEDWNVRMGNFHLTDAEAHALVQYFQAWDAAEIPEADPLLRDEALAARREQVLAVLGYVLDRSVGCVQCHYVEGRPSAGAEAGQTYNAGPDLSRVYERLRPNWLRAWMDNPGAIYPGTVMVQVQQIPQQSRPELFRDRADWLDAIVQLLLRWDYWREDPEVRRVLGAGRN